MKTNINIRFDTKMNIIKDTMPTQYEKKEGHLAYKFGLDYGSLLKKNNVLFLPIQPTFVFEVDYKDLGIYQGENVVEIPANSETEIYKLIHNHVLASLFEFNIQVRGQFTIPDSVKYIPPTFKEIQDKFGEKIRRFLLP